MKKILIGETKVKYKDFYPTPDTLIEKMLEMIDIDKLLKIKYVLEPSAGKGNIVNYLLNKKISLKNYGFEKTVSLSLDIDCIEIDNNLLSILRDFENKSKRVRVVHNDFLNFYTFKKYDLIIMNPPFSNGAKHLLKAISLQEKFGGDIVCLLNANTLKNPFTNERKELIKLLNKYTATVKYLQNEFVNSERKTSVEVALVYLNIPVKNGIEYEDIYSKMENYYYSEILEEPDMTINEVSTGTDLLKSLIAKFNIEILSGIQLMKTYETFQSRVALYTNTDDINYDKYRYSILKLTVGNESLSINQYIKEVRRKYWYALFDNPKFTGNLTYNLLDFYRNELEKFSEYDFNEFNIKILFDDIATKMNSKIEDTIIELFNEMTSYGYYKDSGNIYLYNGWKSNSAHKINKKIVLPFYNCYRRYSWDNSAIFNENECNRYLADMERILDYLDKGYTEKVDILSQLNKYKDNPKNIPLKYFKVSFYKKGTVHIQFTNLDILDKLNIYVGRKKNWLPPSYGKFDYKDLDNESKTIINEFQGEKEYNKIYANKDFYIIETDVKLLKG